MIPPKEARTERVNALSKIALGILHRNGDRGYIHSPGRGRCRVSHVRHNEFKLSLSTAVNESQTATLEIRFEGEKVLRVEWTRSMKYCGRLTNPAIGKTCCAATIARRR
jgi:hypothetical protein